MSTHKRENIWVNLILNVVLPSLLLTKGGKWFQLDPAPILIMALSLPLIYGIYDFITRKKINMFSIIGFISVLITGAVGLFENIPTQWIAIKEAAVPLLFGIAIYVSSFTKKPLIRSLLFSPELFDVDLIEASLDEKGTRKDFDQVMSSCTGWMVGSFALSAVLNYALAEWLVKSPSGTEAFNSEIGKMTALSWPVIALPTTIVMMVALMKLMKGIETATGHPLDDVLHPEVREKLAAKDAALEKKRAEKATPKNEGNEGA
ncbi:MFS transporter [Kiritimatiellota bacterium B12222]|nr:MFS transporter [Kiritimatiellota bacterium B12222]